MEDLVMIPAHPKASMVMPPVVLATQKAEARSYLEMKEILEMQKAQQRVQEVPYCSAILELCEKTRVQVLKHVGCACLWFWMAERLGVDHSMTRSCQG